MIETDGFALFNNDWLPPYVRPLDISDCRFGRATHGHQPDKDPLPTLMAFDPDIQPGAVMERAGIVDGPVTVARVLGPDMGDVDGHAIEGILRQRLRQAHAGRLACAAAACQAQ